MVPDAAAALKAALRYVKHVVPPVDPVSRGPCLKKQRHRHSLTLGLNLRVPGMQEFTKLCTSLTARPGAAPLTRSPSTPYSTVIIVDKAASAGKRQCGHSQLHNEVHKCQRQDYGRRYAVRQRHREDEHHGANLVACGEHSSFCAHDTIWLYANQWQNKALAKECTG